MNKILYGSIILIVSLVIYLLFRNINFKEELELQLNNNDSCVIISLKETKKSEQINLIDTVHFLKLEAKENAFFGHVTKLRVYKNHVFIFDKRYAKCLFIYDKKGKHIRTIKSLGRGPGEFVNLENFEIDYYLDELVLMDIFQSKFLYYDLDGNFKNEVISQVGATHAAFLKDKKIVHAKFPDDFWKGRKKKDQIQLIITNEEGKIIYKKFNYRENLKLNIQLYDVIKGLSDKTINYAPLLQDTIFTITEDGELKPKYVFEFENNVSRRYRTEGSTEELYKEVAQGKKCFLGHNIESENYLFVKLGVAWYYDLVFYSKKSKNAIMISRDREGTLDIFEPMACDNDYFWGMILPNNICNLKFDNIVFDSSKINITENDNPLLFYYKINEF